MGADLRSCRCKADLWQVIQTATSLTVVNARSVGRGSSSASCHGNGAHQPSGGDVQDGQLSGSFGTCVRRPSTMGQPTIF
jgi:hypothetical protein